MYSSTILEIRAWNILVMNERQLETDFLTIHPSHSFPLINKKYLGPMNIRLPGNWDVNKTREFCIWCVNKYSSPNISKHAILVLFPTIRSPRIIFQVPRVAFPMAAGYLEFANATTAKKRIALWLSPYPIEIAKKLWIYWLRW